MHESLSDELLDIFLEFIEGILIFKLVTGNITLLPSFITNGFVFFILNNSLGNS